MNNIKKTIKEFNDNLIAILPEYQKNINLFSKLKIFNYYLYFFLFISFCFFFLSFFIFKFSFLTESLFNDCLVFFSAGFFINIFFSFVSFQQQCKIYKEVSTNQNPLAFYTLLHSIVFFIFLSTLISATFALFFTYLSFQMPYFIFILKLEKAVKKQAEKLKKIDF